MKKEILLFLFVVLTGLLSAIDPWGNPEILPGSMVISAQIQVQNLPVEAGDVLAAFTVSNGQLVLRGKSIISTIDSVSCCMIQVFSQTANEFLFFRFWDESEQKVIISPVTLNSQVNTEIGSWPDNLFQIPFGAPPSEDNALLAFVFVNNTVIDNFDPDNMNQTIPLPVNTTTVPTLWVIPQNYYAQFNIVIPSNLNGEFLVNVTSADLSVVNTYHLDLFTKTLVLNLPVNITVSEDIPLTVDLSPYISSNFYNSEDMYVSVQGGAHITTLSNGYSIHIIPDPNWNGTTSLIVSLHPLDDPAVITDQTSVVVNSVNDPPVFEIPNTMTMNENQPQTLNMALWVYDLDNTVLFLTAQSSEHITVTTANMNATFTPAHDWFGVENISLTVTDAMGASVTQEVEVTVFHVISGNDPYQIANYSLGNYPNPFNPSTTISYSLKKQGEVSLKVFNMKGQLVSILVQEYRNAGNYEIIWNGKDDRNMSLGSGVYFIVLQTSECRKVEKAILIK